MAFAFLGAIEESSDNLGQLLMVLGVRDEVVREAANTLAAAQGAGGEAVKDEDQYMVCEDGHFVPLVVGLLLHLHYDLVEQGRRWKWWRCRLIQRRSTCGDWIVRSLVNRWKLASYSDE